MLLPHTDTTHITFWRQFMSWLVNDTPTRVVASTRQPMLSDDGHLKLRAEGRDTTYLPSSDAQGEAKILCPDAASHGVPFPPRPPAPRVYFAAVNARPRRP